MFGKVRVDPPPWPPSPWVAVLALPLPPGPEEAGGRTRRIKELTNGSVREGSVILISNLRLSPALASDGRSRVRVTAPDRGPCTAQLWMACSEPPLINETAHSPASRSLVK